MERLTECRQEFCIEGFRAQLQQEREARQQAEADNAVLMKLVKEYYSKTMREYHKCFALGLKDTFLELQVIVDSLHPGSALLERLQQTEKALNKVCADLACDDQCPHCGELDFAPWPECENCPGNTGEIHQNTDRDIKCWERYYLQQAKEGKAK
ncbi:MAG: hypothetical protein PHI24_13895 [Desulfitobacteriaceae bacterium]|nr:hypothetical protein [Desulfitobacteriaceae bacterium]